MPDTRPLLFQRVLKGLVDLGNRYRIPLLSALIFGFLAHAFAFTNKLVNHDEVQCLFSKGATVVSGRWGLGALDSVFPNVSMPWIYGVITVVLLAISVCFLVSVLRIRCKWMQVLCAGLVLTFPSLTGTFGFLFTSSSYGVAFLLAVVSVWLLQHRSGRYWLGALLCMVLSLSIYQSYVSLSAAVLVLVLIRQLLDGENVLCLIRRGIAYVIFLVLALGIYYGATQMIQSLLQVPMGEYASNSIGFSLKKVFTRDIPLTYLSFFQSFREDALGLIPTRFSRQVHCVLLACASILLLLRVLRIHSKPLSVLLLVFLIAILPLAVNCIYLFTYYWSIHTLVLYSFICVYLLVLVLADDALLQTEEARWAEYLRRCSLNAVVGLSAMILAINVYIANEAYLNLYLRYENAYAFYTSVIADIKMSPDFTEGTRLAVIGTWDDPDFYGEYLDFTNSLTGVTGFKPDSYSKARFMEFYIGFTIPFASEEEQAKIAASPEFAEMPVYPYYGSVKKIGDTMVVKLS